MRPIDVAPGQECLALVMHEHGQSWTHVEVAEDDGRWYAHATGEEIELPDEVAPLPGTGRRLDPEAVIAMLNSLRPAAGYSYAEGFMDATDLAMRQIRAMMEAADAR